jgi:hypothetical protein
MTGRIAMMKSTRNSTRFLRSGLIEQPINGSTAAGDIVSLNARDGLFLRAEHLEAIQAYARDLSTSIGIAAGTGVVYGFDVTIDQAKSQLAVEPGLAIGPTGQPIRSAAFATVSLKRDDLPPLQGDGFWVIEVNSIETSFGSEPTYGNVCDDPCSGSGAAIQPWTDHGASVSLRADAIGGLDTVGPSAKRCWLASHYFDRERRRRRPWLVPSDAKQINSLIDHDWTKGAAQPVPAGVPIGTIQLIGETLALDVWTARRGCSGPLADEALKARLAMRPLNVFLAEVFQFQDQLSSAMGRLTLVPDIDAVDRRSAARAGLIDAARGTMLEKSPEFQTVLAKWSPPDDLGLTPLGPPSLRALGFDELPPAGYLPFRDGKLEEQLHAWFDPGVDWRVCHVRADHVATAVNAAQHLDRIPLTLPRDVKPVVDILVPDVPADLEGLFTEAYGWIAFVRRIEAQCDDKSPGNGQSPKHRQASDQSESTHTASGIQIYHSKAPRNDKTRARAQRVPDNVVKLGTLTLATRTSDASPEDEAAKLASEIPGDSVTSILIIGAPLNRRLVLKRAELLKKALDVTAPIREIPAVAGERDSIVVVTYTNV